VVLYPVWLLGCKLSERAPSLGAQRMSRGEIWRWRFTAWAAMWVSELLNFHLHVTRVHSMVFAGAFAALWIRKEIIHLRYAEPPRWLQGAGAWSYSLYLIHPAVFTAYAIMVPGGFTGHRRRLASDNGISVYRGLCLLFDGREAIAHAGQEDRLVAAPCASIRGMPASDPPRVYVRDGRYKYLSSDNYIFR
jgi:hypothetical protein